MHILSDHLVSWCDVMLCLALVDSRTWPCDLFVGSLNVLPMSENISSQFCRHKNELLVKTTPAPFLLSSYRCSSFPYQQIHVSGSSTAAAPLHLTMSFHCTIVCIMTNKASYFSFHWVAHKEPKAKLRQKRGSEADRRPSYIPGWGIAQVRSTEPAVALQSVAIWHRGEARHRLNSPGNESQVNHIRHD